MDSTEVVVVRTDVRHSKFYFRLTSQSPDIPAKDAAYAEVDGDTTNMCEGTRMKMGMRGPVRFFEFMP